MDSAFSHAFMIALKLVIQAMNRWTHVKTLIILNGREKPDPFCFILMVAERDCLDRLARRMEMAHHVGFTIHL